MPFFLAIYTRETTFIIFITNAYEYSEAQHLALCILILIMKYFLRSFSLFRWFKKGSYQFLAKECAQYWLTA